MTKRFSSLLCFMAVIFMAAPLALAQGGVYVAPKVMLSIQNIDSQGYDLHKYFPDYRRFMADESNKTGPGLGLAVGYDFGVQDYGPFRAELEYLARSKASISLTDNMLDMVGNGEVSLLTQTIFANFYYDIPTESVDWTPYIGFGLGLSHFDAESRIRINDNNPWSMQQRHNAKNSAWNFAWNLGGGFSFPLDNGIDLDLGYRYSDFGDIDFTLFGDRSGVSLQNTVDSTAHELMLGLRFTGF